MTDNLKLLMVVNMPVEIESGILYVSEKYGVAGHLCPCGCGNKIITPLDDTEWELTKQNDKPTLYPSVGNWQLDCRSHYWIRNGKIVWAGQWTDEQIEEGWLLEEENRKLYYDTLLKNRNSSNIIIRLINWIKRLFK